MKATVAACCIVLILFFSLSLVDGLGIGCNYDKTTEVSYSHLRARFVNMLSLLFSTAPLCRIQIRSQLKDSRSHFLEVQTWKTERTGKACR